MVGPEHAGFQRPVRGQCTVCPVRALSERGEPEVYLSEVTVGDGGGAWMQVTMQQCPDVWRQSSSLQVGVWLLLGRQ